MGKLRTEWNKIRGMKRRDALWYVWEYYKIHLMFLAIILFFVVLIIQANVINRQETVLSVLMADLGVEQEKAAAFADRIFNLSAGTVTVTAAGESLRAVRVK